MGSLHKVGDSKTWYGSYVDELGIRRRKALASDKGSAQQLLAQLELRVERRKSGLEDNYTDNQLVPLTEHFEAFRAHLSAKGNSERYIVETLRDGYKVAKAQTMIFLRDLTAERVECFIAEQMGAGKSPRTVNSKLISLQVFTSWCVKTGRLRDNPLRCVSKRNQAVDVRRVRRTLSAEEFARLINTTAASGTHRHLNGADRAMLYTVAVATGLRAAELGSLTTASLSLEGDPPLIVLEAAYSKRRRKDEQPLPDWLVNRLRKWLAERERPLRVDGEEKLWPGGWIRHASKLMREDLAAAGLEYRNEAGEVFDFHSLRHQFITSLVESKAHPKVAQTLARHSTITLTMDRYTHLHVADVAAAVNAVPDPTRSPAGRAERATGTFDAKPGIDHDAQRSAPNRQSAHGANFARKTDFQGVKLASCGTEKRGESRGGSDAQSETSQALSEPEGEPNLRATRLSRMDWNSGAAQAVAGSSPVPSALVFGQWSLG